MGTRVGDRYVLHEELASQERMRLFTAREGDSEKLVLLREILPVADDPTFPERFAREVQRLKGLDHPSIAKLVDSFELEGKFYLVWEHIGGVPLSSYRPKYPEIVKARAEPWLNHLAEVLEELHADNPPFVLGEFGPDDILVTSMGRLRLVAVRSESLRPPDSLEMEPPGTATPADPDRTPAYFDVHSLVRLGWWMMTGKEHVIGQAQAPLDPDLYPDISKVWLKGLNQAMDPTYPVPPQTVTDLRRLLLGHETVSAELPPRMEYEVAEIRFMQGPKGRMVQGTLRVVNTGGGELNGYVRATQRWVRIIPNTFRGNDVELEFWIDSSGMKAAEEHKAHIFLKSQNEEADIPVHITTGPHWLSELPDLVAAVAPFVPGMVCMLLMSLMFWKAQMSARAVLEEAHRISLEGLHALPAEVVERGLPLTNSAVADTKLAGLVAVIFAVLVPWWVYNIVRRYPRKQRDKLMWAQVLGLVSPLLWLGILWQRPTFNDVVIHHPAFSALNLKASLAFYAALNLGAAVLFSTPVQQRLDRVFRKNESGRNTLMMGLMLVGLALAAKILFF